MCVLTHFICCFYSDSWIRYFFLFEDKDRQRSEMPSNNNLYLNWQFLSIYFRSAQICAEVYKQKYYLHVNWTQANEICKNTWIGFCCKYVKTPAPGKL